MTIRFVIAICATLKTDTRKCHRQSVWRHSQLLFSCHDSSNETFRLRGGAIVVQSVAHICDKH